MRKQKRVGFSAKLQGDRHSALYNFLGYSSKKPYEPIKAYVSHFSNRGDLVLDPFCGSGGLGIVGSNIGRNCIIIDSSPLASLIAKAYSTFVAPDDIESAFSMIEQSLMRPRKELYGTICHLDDKEVEIEAAIWSQTYRCVKCLKTVSLKSTVDDRNCPHCAEPIRLGKNA